MNSIINSEFYFRAKHPHSPFTKNMNCTLPKLGALTEGQIADAYEWRACLSKSSSPLNLDLCIDIEERVVLFAGSLYSTDARKAAEKQLLYVESGEEVASFLRGITGVFSGLIYLKNEDRLFVFVDQFGVKKLFYSLVDGEIFVSNHLARMPLFTGRTDFSSQAFASILYCGHVFKESVLDGVSQVNAGCCVEIHKGRVRESEYVTYLEPESLSFKEAVGRVREAHQDFWQRMEPVVGGDITLLLSRGKDARVALKYMLDSGVNPQLMSFYRRSNPLYPFVSFLREWTDDYKAAAQVASVTGAPFHGLEIPNGYLLDHLDEIVKLNHGTPLHWEFLAAAQDASKRTKYIATGFVGDVIAGKSHHYYLMKKIRSASEYGLIEFQHAGSSEMYVAIMAVLKDTGFRDLPTIEELEGGWRRQYEIAQSDDLNIIFQQGIFRTRVLGRTGPTFDQMRRFAHPIYPYNDNRIIDAYRALPEKFLRWEKAHVAQLADDARFSRINTTRLNISVKQELYLLDLMGWLRRLDTGLRHSKAAKPVQSVEKDEALRRTLEDLGLGQAIWNQFRRLPRTPAFYQTVANLIAAMRIEQSVSAWPVIPTDV